MTLTPLLNASPVIQIHTIFALFAVVLTIAIFALRKGTSRHRLLGRVWVAAMGFVALSSFFINEIRMIGPFGPIHFLSVFALVNLFLGVRAARAGNIRLHRRIMSGLVFGALGIAGAFTFLPGRLMYQLVTGG